MSKKKIKSKPSKPHRGRFQAQGGGTEKSHNWAEDKVPTKTDGHDYLDDLRGQLTRSEFKLRKTCLDKASSWIDRAPANDTMPSNL